MGYRQGIWTMARARGARGARAKARARTKARATIIRTKMC